MPSNSSWPFIILWNIGKAGLFFRCFFLLFNVENCNNVLILLAERLLLCLGKILLMKEGRWCKLEGNLVLAVRFLYQFHISTLIPLRSLIRLICLNQLRNCHHSVLIHIDCYGYFWVYFLQRENMNSSHAWMHFIDSMCSTNFFLGHK